MPQPNKIPLAFAASGDKNVIPESTETTGFASWRDGFPAITSAPFSEGGIAPKRADFNGIFYALSQAVMWMQQGGLYAYDVNTDYEAGNVVFDAGGLYVANAANGPSSAVVQPSTDTTGATWKPVRLDLATQSAAGYMSAADKAKLDGLISTLATQFAAGYMSAADKTKLDGLISTDATQSAAGYMSGADKTKLDGLISTDATQSAAGYMSAADKTKLDGIESGAQVNPGAATQSANGLMSAADKIKLDGISYSAGIWTPVVKGSINAGTIIQTNFADYLKINRLVFIWARVFFRAAASNYPTGSLLVSGLPYTPMSGYKLQPLSAYGYGGVDDCFRRITKAIVSSDSLVFNVTSISGSNQYYAQFVDGTPTGDEVALRTDDNSEIWLCGGYLTDE